MNKPHLIILLLLCCLTSLCPALSESLDTPGAYSVQTLEYQDLFDSKRQRAVPMKLFWGQRAPLGHLVVLSHGAGGNWDSHYALAAHLASHGFVVVCPEHVRSNTKRLRKSLRSLGLIGSVKSFTRDPEANLQRPRDISFTIDQAALWNRSHPELKGKILTDQVGLMGHSFGAYTTLTVCGARPLLDYLPNSGTGLAKDMSDPRVAFGIALSPQAPGEPFFTEKSYRTIDRPVIGISGTRDKQQGPTRRGLPPSKRKAAFQLWPAGDKVFLWLKNADHLAFTDNSGSGGRKARWRGSKTRTDTSKIVKATALLACRIHLRKDSEARRVFSKTTLEAFCGEAIPSLEWLER